MSTITIAEQIQVIKEATKQASKSKEAALKFLISAGIEGRKAKASSIKRAKKQAKSR
jgi:flagellar basal body L-ring protein FlgH